MEAAFASRTATVIPRLDGMRQGSVSLGARTSPPPLSSGASHCTLGIRHLRGALPRGVHPERLRHCQQPRFAKRFSSSGMQSSLGRVQYCPPVRASSQTPSNAPTSVDETQLPEPACSHQSANVNPSSSTPPSASPANSPPAQLPIPLALLALRFPACQEALSRTSPHVSRLASSTIAAGRFVLWFVSGRYIPSQMKVLFTLLRAERFYRKRIRTIDGRQLLYELNFLPELPDLAAVFPMLVYVAVLARAVISSVSALGSFNLLHGSAAVPGLPEVELPTIGRSVASGYPDKSDQPETPGYEPLGEWIGPRGMKPWERNAVTITPEERKKLWEKNYNIYTLHPYNSTPRERKILVALAAISSILTQMWTLLHMLLVPLLFLGFMATIEKPLFWLLGQLYKLRKYVGDFKGPLSQS